MWTGLIIAGLTASIHICEPGWFRHAGDNIGGTSRYYSRENLRQQWEEDIMLRLPSDHATGTLNRHYLNLAKKRKKIVIIYFSTNKIKRLKHWRNGAMWVQ